MQYGGPPFFRKKMYFVIVKRADYEQFSMPNSAAWADLTAKIGNDTVVEIFQNDLLEMKHFLEYFNGTYRRNNKDAGKARRHH